MKYREVLEGMISTWNAISEEENHITSSFSEKTVNDNVVTCILKVRNSKIYLKSEYIFNKDEVNTMFYDEHRDEVFKTIVKRVLMYGLTLYTKNIDINPIENGGEEA